MRVLMVCYGYPPIGGAGMIRPLKFAKFLPQLGWQPTVLTPQEGVGRIACGREMGEFPGVTVVRTPYRDIVSLVKKRLGIGGHSNGNLNQPVPDGDTIGNGKQSGFFPAARRIAYDLLTTPDEHVGWYRPALDVARELMRSHKFDVIYSTSPPETTHLIARALKREFGVPWVAELRDPWSFDHYRQRSWLKRRMLSEMERRVFKDADALVTVSDMWRSELEKCHSGRASKPVFSIPHGFDQEDYPQISPPLSANLTVCYTGSMDRNFQDPKLFFEVLSALLQEGRVHSDVLRINLHAYGDNLPDFEGLVQHYGLRKVVNQCPLLEYRMCLATQQASTILLLLQWRGEMAKGIQYVKGYEYLGARRPILVVGTGEGPMGELIRETRSGEIATTKEDLRRVLLNWYDEFVQTGTVRFRGEEEAIHRYTRSAQTAKLVEVFDYVLNQNPAG